MIGLRFLLRALLVLAGHIHVELEGGGGDDDDDEDIADEAAGEGVV
jgi:hypothetical protein